VVAQELARITSKCQRYQERQGYVPRWVERGMGERFSRAEQLEHRVQMLLGVFSAKGVLLSMASLYDQVGWPCYMTTSASYLFSLKAVVVRRAEGDISAADGMHSLLPLSCLSCLYSLSASLTGRWRGRSLLPTMVTTYALLSRRSSRPSASTGLGKSGSRSCGARLVVKMNEPRR
jgi:hypothetical protein